jgi:hypothetical protein
MIGRRRATIARALQLKGGNVLRTATTSPIVMAQMPVPEPVRRVILKKKVTKK